MEYTYQKGLKISKISLGTVQLGLSYGINNANGMPEEKTSHDILKTAIDGGINVIDTASVYGSSETVIGDFLKSNTTHKPTIVTKFIININADKPANHKDVEGILRQQVENSLQVMHLNKLPILMLHRENEMFDYDDILPNALKKLRNEGLVERIGVSLTSNKHIDYIANNDLYEAVQIPLNIMDTSIIKDGGIEKLCRADIIVFVRSVFLQGLFFKDPENLPQGILQKAAEPLRQIRSLSQAEGISVANLAISFIRDLEGVSSLVLGSETPKQVIQNLELVKSSPPLSKNIRSKIMSMFDDIEPRIIMPWTWDNE